MSTEKDGKGSEGKAAVCGTWWVSSAREIVAHNPATTQEGSAEPSQFMATY